MSDTEALTEQEFAADLLPNAAEQSNNEGSTENAITATNAAEAQHEACGNCAAPLLGPHCYACGQPVKSLIRQFPELIADVFGTLFALDSRIARTFGPLLFRPGFLTREYLAGRQVRYVSPVRLFVFLCLTAFFVAQLSSDWRTGTRVNLAADNATAAGININSVEVEITRATTVEEVIRLRDEALAEINDAEREGRDIPGIRGLLTGVEHVVRAHANRRILEIDPSRKIEEPALAVNDELEPLQFEGLPDAANAWLEQKFNKLNSNLSRIERDPNLLKDALFGAIPSTLFVLLPFFALLLNVAYIFKRRLYMEHLIVALHSHAFLSLALLLSVILLDLREWIAPAQSLLESGFNLLLSALAIWMPIYLLLMQKRVYQQGWFATSVKFLVLGSCYLVLISAAAAFTALSSLVNL